MDASYGSPRDSTFEYHERFSELKQRPVNDHRSDLSLQNELNSKAHELHRFQFPRINFTACIAATRDLADTEQLIYTALTFGEVIYKSVVEFWDQILTCRSDSPNDMEFVLCFITELENSGSIWESILSDIYTLLSGLEHGSLITDLKNCLGLYALTCLSC